MTSVKSESTSEARFRSVLPDRRVWASAILVGLAYYLGARLGFALTLRPVPISTMWPPNTILLAALLLTPTSWWWVMLLAALPAHLAVELNNGYPTALVFGWYLSNCSQALIGAGLVRAFVKTPLRFDRSRDVGVFIFCAAFVATFISSFIDVSFVTLAGLGGDSYWSLWQVRFLSNALTTLTLGATILAWSRGTLPALQAAPPRRYLEATLLALGLLAVSIYVFNGQRAELNPSPVLLYAPLPFLLWSAIRFGARGKTTALLAVTLLAIWGAVHGHGPFTNASSAENAFAIQTFLIVMAIPLLILASVIGEREHAERFAKTNEERLNLALDAAEMGAWEWRAPEDRVTYTDRSKEIFGHVTPVQTTLAEFLRPVHPDDRPALEENIYRALEQGTSYECEFRIRRPDSTTVWILGKGKALYNNNARPVRMLGVHVDITERRISYEHRREEAALRESEARLREMADAMPQVVWTATPDGRLDYFNRRWYELTGASPDIAMEDPLLMTHPDDRDAVRQAWESAVATGSPISIEHRLHDVKAGDYRWHLLRAIPIREGGGAVIRWYGSCTDIQDQKGVEHDLRDIQSALEERVNERTAEVSGAVVQLLKEIEDRVTAEQGWRASDAQFGRAFHGSPDASAIIRQSDYRITEVNQKWETLFGYSREEAVGRTGTELGMIIEEEEQHTQQILGSSGVLREYEIDARTKSGKVIRTALTTNSVDMAGEACYIVVIRDVTERRRNEAVLQEQQRELAHLSRVASLGELSGALAHELNQPLASILTNARAAQRMIPRDQPYGHEIREILEDIANDDLRAGEVIQRLRSLLKKSDLQPRPVRLADIVREVLSLVHSDLIQRRVSVESEVPRSLPKVMGDRVQLQQVLLNLILNACDAMSHMPPHDRRLAIRASSNGDGAIELSVSDCGIGIGPARLEQIFEPFVTTKEDGLGLGLAICRSIVAAHGGRLWAVNNEDRGATFLMLLHPADAEQAVIPITAASPDRLHG